MRPSDDVLAAFSVTEPATENYQPAAAGGGTSTGGVARVDHLLFATLTFLPYTFQ